MNPEHPPFEVLRLDHVVLAVSDLQRAENFYIQLLGVQVERRLEKPKLVQLRVGESLLDLVPGSPHPTQPNMAHYCFRIDPFDPVAITAHLGRLGIAVAAMCWKRVKWFCPIQPVPCAKTRGFWRRIWARQSSGFDGSKDGRAVQAPHRWAFELQLVAIGVAQVDGLAVAIGPIAFTTGRDGNP